MSNSLLLAVSVLCCTLALSGSTSTTLPSTVDAVPSAATESPSATTSAIVSFTSPTTATTPAITTTFAIITTSSATTTSTSAVTSPPLDITTTSVTTTTTPTATTTTPDTTTTIPATTTSAPSTTTTTPDTTTTTPATTTTTPATTTTSPDSTPTTPATATTTPATTTTTPATTTTTPATTTVIPDTTTTPATTTTTPATTTTTPATTTTTPATTPTTPATTTTTPATTTTTPDTTPTTPATTTTTPPTTTTTPAATTTTPATTTVIPDTTTTPATTTTTPDITTTTPATTTTIPDATTTTSAITTTIPDTTTTPATTTSPLHITTTTTSTPATTTTPTTTKTTSPVILTTSPIKPTTSANKTTTTAADMTTVTTFPTTTSQLPTSTTPTTLRTTVKQFDIPIVRDWFPKFGPLECSTKIVLQGIRLNNTIVEVNFENIGAAHILDSTYYTVTLLSPTANFTAIVSLAVVAAYNRKVVANLSFEYRRNPIITGFGFARHQVTTGGSPLTVIGESLDSVASPQLNVTVVAMATSSRSKRIVKRATSMSTNSYNQNCTFDETTRNMTCLLPDLQLGDNFTRKLQRDQEANVSTSTTQTGSVAKLYGPNDTVAFVYIGFVFETCTKYDNISDRKSGLNESLYLNFIPPPAINASKKLIYFNPDTDDNIAIKGQLLGLYCDYVYRCDVLTGHGNCTISKVTENQITCRPPQVKPLSDPKVTYCAEEYPESFTIVVFIGFYSFYYQCLEYYYFDKVPLIVGLTVGLGVPILTLFIIIVICFYRRRKRKLSQNDEPRQNQPSRDSLELQDHHPDHDYTTDIAANSGNGYNDHRRVSRQHQRTGTFEDGVYLRPPHGTDNYHQLPDPHMTNSADQLDLSGFKRNSVFPPPSVGLGAAHKDRQPGSSQDLLFPPSGDHSPSVKSSQVNGNQTLKEILESDIPLDSKAQLARQEYLRKYSQSYIEHNHNTRDSLSDYLLTTRNHQSMFPPDPVHDGGDDPYPSLRITSDRESVFPP